MIATSLWYKLSHSEFEKLALEHVRDIYTECSWYCTSLTADGGKDAVGEFRKFEDELAEIYWMEAKHHPKNRSIGKYTLDTHLVSAFFSKGVKRLHVVTSGVLSGNFISRADVFGKEHGFIFAHSDCDALEAWLASRHDIVNKFFGSAAPDVLDSLEKSDASSRLIFARASIFADNDNLTSSPVPISHLLPGKKFRLVVSVSVASKIPKTITPLKLKWSVPPQRISLLTNQDSGGAEIMTFDPSETPVINLPFRLHLFSNSTFPGPTIHSADGTELLSTTLDGIQNLPRLASPFVGNIARQELFRLRRLLSDEVLRGRAQIIICRGRAGSGKTRLAEELRDDAQTLGFTVGLIEMTSTSRTQEERWRQLFRWIFGLEHNPFNLAEEELIENCLSRFDLLPEDRGDLTKILMSFLKSGVYSEDLFDPNLLIGRNFASVIRATLNYRLERPVLFHIDDAHHLSRRQLRPLYLLRYLIETSDSLPFCLLVSGRNDETVRDNYFQHFVHGLEFSDFTRFCITDIPDMTSDDAKELIITTLRCPELLAEESKTLELIIRRAGTNPFVLMQTIDHLAIDYETISFGHGDDFFILDIPAFKRALLDLPKGVWSILSQRFAGLLKQGEHKLLSALVAMAIIGRRSPRRAVNRALEQPLTTHDVRRLLALDYLAEATGQHFELAHDLLVEALWKRPETGKVASRLASSIREEEKAAFTDEQRAAIYHAAGPRYYRKSWDTTYDIIKSCAGRQEYVTLPPLFKRLEDIAYRSKNMVFDSELSWVAAVADQHCGNTYSALRKFIKIKEIAEQAFPDALERYIDASIEIGNQYILRVQPTLALQNIFQAIEILEDPTLRLPRRSVLRLKALAHNRCGAALHFLDRRAEASRHFDIALDASSGIDDYLRSHTHWNIAAMMRFSDPTGAAYHLRTARNIWNEKANRKERLRILLDLSEAYSECLSQNSFLARARLRAVAAETVEKGYHFQASGALLCLSTCLIKAEAWEEAKAALLRAFDLTTITEDLKNRMFIAHYLSLCANKLGTNAECRDWCRQSTQALGDGDLEKIDLVQFLRYNETVAGDIFPENAGDRRAESAADLKWYVFDRA